MGLPLSTIDRPLGLRARADLLAVAVPVAGMPMWVIKDPLTLEQYQLSPQEYALLSRLRDEGSLRDLQRHFEQQFAPARADVREIWATLARLHRAGLLVGNLPGQGEALAERHRERRSRERRWGWTRLLALRLPGVNPDRGLDRVMEVARPLFGEASLAVAVLIVVAAAGLLLTHASEFVGRLPSLALMTAPANWPWLMLTIVLLKVLHELGHALVAKRLGAEVPEMGILLLVFLPTLYCDVSDIWRLPSKWQRMAVSAAGIGVETVVASLATFVWWFSEPGLVHWLALDVMVIATLGTLAVNANPLLRYDGYYLLSDLTETPNLWQRSRDALRTRLAEWFFVVPPRDRPLKPEPLWLAGYALLSKGYLTLVMLAIFFSLVTLLTPHGLQLLAYGAGGVMVATTLAGAGQLTATTLKSPLKRSQFRPSRAAIALLAVAGLVAGLLRWPLVDSVYCQATVVPHQGVRVVTTLEGRLEFALPAGTEVAPGDVIARLTSDHVEQQLVELEVRVAEAEQRLKGLEALRRRDPGTSAQIPVAREELEELRRQLDRHRQEAERLVLRAPVAGRIMAPPTTPEEKDETRLPTWSGTPLEPKNRGAWLPVGTLVALVSPTDRCDVMVEIDERDIELVAPGQPARVQLAQQGGNVIEAEVAEIARRGRQATPSEPQTMGLARFIPNPLAGSSYTSRFEARLVTTEPLEQAIVDGGGRAKIETGRTALGVWLMRELRDTFRLN